jgi:hypothetical protein
LEKKMTKKSNQSALVHGFYSSDIVLPWERAEDFQNLLEGIRLDFMPTGTTEDEIVFEIASLQWKKRRLYRSQQLAVLESPIAADIDNSGKRSVPGIHRFRKSQRLVKTQFPAAVVNLSEAMTLIAESVANKKNPPLGKIGANLRGVARDVEEILSYIKSEEKPQPDEMHQLDEKTRADEEASNNAYGLDTIGQDNDMEERLDALIEKSIKRLIIVREFQRMYGHDSSTKLIEQRASNAKQVSSTPTVTKPTVTKVGRKAAPTKSKSANDNWNNDQNNDDDNDNNEDGSN